MNIRLARLVVGALIVLAAALGLASSARAQSDATSGTIEGVVSDATGGVLPGATVRLTNAATGFVRDVVTDEEGRYRGLALPLGTYTIAVEMSGFARASAKTSCSRSAACCASTSRSASPVVSASPSRAARR